MARTERIIVRVSTKEKLLLKMLAARDGHQNASEYIRFLIRSTAQDTPAPERITQP